MNFRVDPIDERGVFDHDFYCSEGYKKQLDALLSYLKAEGFENNKEEFHIKFNKHCWVCVPTYKKQ